MRLKKPLISTWLRNGVILKNLSNDDKKNVKKAIGCVCKTTTVRAHRAMCMMLMY